MFGQDNQQPDNNHIPDQSIDGAMHADNQGGSDNPGGDQSWQHPGTPIEHQEHQEHQEHHDDGNPQVQGAPVVTPHSDGQSDDNTDDNPAPAGSVPHDLIDIKQHALGQLAPLVGHLDQTPEEKFRTLMMMIQASDDQTKIKEAYAAANDIQDEKVKAQALLDIVNEINYFTTQHHQEN